MISAEACEGVRARGGRLSAHNIDQVGVAWAIRPLRSIAKAWSWIHATEPLLSGPFDREGRLSCAVLADLMPEVRGVQAFSLSRSLCKQSEKPRVGDRHVGSPAVRISLGPVSGASVPANSGPSPVMGKSNGCSLVGCSGRLEITRKLIRNQKFDRFTKRLRSRYPKTLFEGPLRLFP